MGLEEAHLGAVFKGAGDGGAGGDDSSALAQGELDGGGGGGGQAVVLGVQADVFEALDADGLEGAEAYVEGEGFDLDATGFQGVQCLRREVKAGGGGGGGAGLAGVDGLVAGLVFGFVWTMHVRRQRHVADAVELGEELGVWGEAEDALAELAGGEDFGGENGWA